MSEVDKDLELIDKILDDVLVFYKTKPHKNNFNSEKYVFSGLNQQFFYKKIVSKISDELKEENPNFFVCAVPSSPNTFTIGCIRNRNVPNRLNGSSYNGFFAHEWLSIEKQIILNEKILLQNEITK